MGVVADSHEAPSSEPRPAVQKAPVVEHHHSPWLQLRLELVLRRIDDLAQGAVGRVEFLSLLIRQVGESRPVVGVEPRKIKRTGYLKFKFK